jgi:hypothetical protein
MSGSPKCCQATIAAERRRALEAERRRREELEANERASAAREHRAERMKSLSAHVRATLRGIGDYVTGASSPGASVSDETARVEAEYRDLLIRADSATDFEAMSRLESEVGELAGRLRALLASGQAQARPSAGAYGHSRRTDATPTVDALAASDGELRELRVLVELEDAKGSARFDEDGRKKLRSALDAAEAALVREDVDLSRVRLSDARLAYRAHSETARTRRRDWEENYHTCRAGLEEARALVAGTRDDKAVSRWSLGRIAEADAQLDHAERALAGGFWSKAAGSASEAKRLLDRAVVEARDREVAEAERRYIVKSLVDVLSARFVCEQPRLIPGESGSTVVIRARRSPARGSRRAVEVRVDGRGGLEYTVDGYEMHREVVDGATAATCDEAEREILELHQALRDRCSIETTELEWDGKPTLDESAPAAEDSAPQRRRRRGVPGASSARNRGVTST